MKKLIIIPTLLLIHSCSSPKPVHRQIACSDCEKSEPIDQSVTTAPDYCSGGQKGTDKERFSRGVNTDNDQVTLNIGYQVVSGVKSVGGYDLYSDQMGPSATYVEEGVEYPTDDEYVGLMYPRRVYSDSFLGRGKENSFEIVDSPVRTDFEGKSDKVKGRYVSTDMRITQYSFFPRKNVPAIKMEGDKFILTLTTGEEIVVDKNTGHVISGVAKEVAAKNPLQNRVDAQGNKNIRQFPDTDFVYQGEGLYIETHLGYSKDEKKPGSIVPVKALVDGKWQECKLKSDELWVSNFGYYLPQGHENFLSSGWSCTRFKFQRDEDLYKLIKKKCPTFKFPKLIHGN